MDTLAWTLGEGQTMVSIDVSGSKSLHFFKCTAKMSRIQKTASTQRLSTTDVHLSRGPQ